MRGKLNHSMRLAAMAALCAAALAAPASAAAQQGDTPATTLDRSLRTLASDPKDFDSLIAAGKAAVAIGDPEAAAGFFARADEVNPRSPLPQAGMGAVSVANGQPQAAMPYFARAIQLGATVQVIGADRGLAYDLMGMQQQAQADYRAGLYGADRTEARRRLALSLAISGDRSGALQMLAPLAAVGDAATSRLRAFILALTGDPGGAMAATNAAMPGSGASVAPFLQRLAGLQPGQKAAAVNLGIFPDASGPALASGAATPAYQAYSARPANSVPAGDRLAGIDELLRQPAPAAAPPMQATAQPGPQQVSQIAYSLPVVRRQPVRPTQPARAAVSRRVWLQLASGSNPAAFADQFRRIKLRGEDMFDGLQGYVVKAPDRSRLLIGPFRNNEDAQTFAANLQDLHITAFSWTNSPSDTIVPLDDAS
jgi:tetratricopeptide (TPR) repeat protein